LQLLILLDIALAADQFYQMLPLLYHYFTGYYICSRSILPDVAFAVPLFYWILHLQQINLPDVAFLTTILLDITLQCTNLPDIALAADQFY